MTPCSRRAGRRSRTGSATPSSRPRIRKEDAVFAGEVSGHYYFRDFYYCDTGVVPALVMLELVSRRGGRSPSCSRPSASATSSRARSTRPWTTCRCKLQALKERYGPDARRVSHMDGVSFEFADWHFNVRPSNTEPLLRLNLEALDPDTMSARRDEVLALIRG